MNKHVSIRQVEIMIEYMEHHKHFALGRVRSKEGRALSDKLWKDLAQLLNSESGAAFRSSKDWNKFYNDYKCRVKAKARKYKGHMNGTGGGPANTAAPLTPLEERLLAILGPDVFDPLPVRHNPLDIYITSKSSSALPASVSLPIPDVEYTVDVPTSISEPTQPVKFPQSHTKFEYSVDQENLIEDRDMKIQDVACEVKAIEEPTKLRATNQRKVQRREKSKAQSNIDKLAQIELNKMQVSREMIKAKIAKNEIEEKKVLAIKEQNIQIGKLAKAASEIAEWIKNN